MNQAASVKNFKIFIELFSEFLPHAFLQDIYNRTNKNYNDLTSSPIKSKREKRLNHEYSLTLFKKNLKNSISPSKHLSIDESMIGFKRIHSMKQYLPMKQN